MWVQYTDFELGDSQLEQYGFRIGLWKSLGILVAVGLIVRGFALYSLKALVRNLQ